MSGLIVCLARNMCPVEGDAPQTDGHDGRRAMGRPEALRARIIYNKVWPAKKWSDPQLSSNGEKNEEIIIPYLYDKLTANVNDIIPAQYHNKSTYISLDINKNTYGKQLVPCILENATPFGTEFENFAECTINSKKGYLPKNCQVLNKIDENTLLTKEQVIYLTNILEKNNEVFDTNEEAITAYYNLTNEFILPNTSVNKIKRK